MTMSFFSLLEFERALGSQSKNLEEQPEEQSRYHQCTVPRFSLKKVISVGYHDAEVGFLLGAKKLGFEVGGSCFPNFMCVDGLSPELLSSLGLTAEEDWEQAYRHVCETIPRNQLIFLDNQPTDQSTSDLIFCDTIIPNMCKERG
eukprot:TRINITY_DN7859_c0_g1_i1.p1 TRINITY_DN7859_c0_g1~~TRINITY_DN7859_c0_g1_i1.p1  ORF type:complete len:145 (+),score=30.01 TRINITY_DN7859_c0_g1_i1:549-983(+)